MYECVHMDKSTKPMENVLYHEPMSGLGHVILLFFSTFSVQFFGFEEKMFFLS